MEAITDGSMYNHLSIPRNQEPTQSGTFFTFYLVCKEYGGQSNVQLAAQHIKEWVQAYQERSSDTNYPVQLTCRVSAEL